MSLEKTFNVAKKILFNKHDDVRFVFAAPIVLAGAIGGAAAGLSITMEDWDDVANDKTVHVVEAFNNRAANLNILSQKLELQEAEKHNWEIQHKMEFTNDADGFAQYEIDKSNWEQQLTTGTDKYVTDLLFNTDITEKEAQKVMKFYSDNRLGQYGAEMPSSQYAYAFKEAQAEWINEEGLTVEYKVDKIREEINQNSSDMDGAFGFIPGGMLAFMVLSGMGVGVSRLEQRVRRRKVKPQVKRNTI